MLVAATQRMTELAAGRDYTATPCTLLVYYSERVTEQVHFLCRDDPGEKWRPY